jgi:uncharacterized membrane protein
MGHMGRRRSRQQRARGGLRQHDAMRLYAHAMRPLPVRILYGHFRIALAAAAGGLGWWGLPATSLPLTRLIYAWDIGCVAFLLLAAAMFRAERTQRMAADAEVQEEGEWTVFAITVVAIAASFAAIAGQYAAVKNLTSGRGPHIALVAATLLLSWLMAQIVFALRYAHEYYAHDNDEVKVDGGLEFPGGEPPDYWDFVYFSLVLGMTFQVSDVQISSRKLRRLAAAHGLLSFVFNTGILALSVNIGASLL